MDEGLPEGQGVNAIWNSSKDVDRGSLFLPCEVKADASKGATVKEATPAKEWDGRGETELWQPRRLSLATCLPPLHQMEATEKRNKELESSAASLRKECERLSMMSQRVGARPDLPHDPPAPAMPGLLAVALRVREAERRARAHARAPLLMSGDGGLLAMWRDGACLAILFGWS